MTRVLRFIVILSSLVFWLDSKWHWRLLLLCWAISRLLCFCFGHKLSALGVSVPAPAFVVNAAIGVNPYLAAALRGCNFRFGGRAARRRLAGRGLRRRTG